MENEGKATEYNNLNDVCGRYPIRWIDIIEQAEYRFKSKISTYSTLQTNPCNFIKTFFKIDMKIVHRL